MEEVALRYGEALYMLALEEKKLISLQSEASNVKAVLLDNRKFIKVISSPFLSKKEREEMIKNIFKDIDKSLLSFLLVILKNNRFDMVLDILEVFNDYCNREQGIKEGVLFASEPVSEETLKNIEAKIAKLENTKVALKVKIDPSLIGGFKVVINEHQYDTSIAKQIEMMRKNLL